VEKGQLGTTVPPRMIFIWEGTVAHLPEGRAIHSLEWIARRSGLFDKAVSYWRVHERTLAWMWTIFARTEHRIDVCVTTRQPEFAMAVARLMEHGNLPVRYVFAQSPAGLGRMLPSMADVSHVYYGLEEQRWAYGPHGVFITPETPIAL
jgi:hypothetical protein